MTVVRDAAASIVIVAAGEGSRLGFGIPKAFVPVGGVPMVQRALESVAATTTEFAVVVVVPADLVERASAMVASVTDGLGVVVAGGASRHESVRRGLAAVPAGCQTVLVHDAARALAPAQLIDRVAAAVTSTGHGIVPGLPIADTIKRIDGSVIEATIDRSTLAAVQTPQGFPLDELLAAYAAVDGEHTDDTAVFAAAGKTVQVVAGDADAFKITTAHDLARAELMLSGGRVVRTGIGIDVHAFGDAGELRLAGLSWPGVPALAGHSDGDAVAHAVCDALLSAAGLGDIGQHFGTSEPQYAGASGEVFLVATLDKLADAGFGIDNVAVQIVGNRPRFSPRRDEAQALLSGLLGAPVSLAATTTDGLGFTGRDEGIAVIATALIRSIR